MAYDHEAKRTKRIARHAKRMGLDEAGIAKATMPVKYPPKKVVAALERATHGGLVQEHRRISKTGEVFKMPRLVSSGGVVVDVIRA